MIEQACAKARRSSVGEFVTFEKSDAEQLDFSDQSFDVVLSLYALFHFPDPLRAMAEMYRVLRPGGRVVIGVGSGPTLLSGKGIWQGARLLADLAAASRGRLLIAPHFLRRLMVEHGMSLNETQGPRTSQPRIERMLRQVGFKCIRKSWQGCRDDLNAEDFWRVQVTFASRERIRLQEAAAQGVAALKQEFLERCRRVQANGGRLVYPHGAMLYVGLRG
jgi:SAM-dependent methyltransferase